VLGAVLDLTNSGVAKNGVYYNWGWAFSVLGIGGLVACPAAIAYARMRRIVDNRNSTY